MKLTKENLGWPTEPPFYVPDSALHRFREAVDRGRRAEDEWNQKLTEYAAAYPELASELNALMHGELPAGWDTDLPTFATDPKGMATRVASGKAMNAVAPKIPGLIGGSADLNPSTHTALAGLGDFENPDGATQDTQGSVGGGWGPAGRNLHFGVREHGMGAILNGLAAHGGLIPFGATFLIFSDYMRPPMRLASLMDLHVIYVFTHDSLALGEDGPTHQPVEQLLGLRAVPGMVLLRPADANETADGVARRTGGERPPGGARADAAVGPDPGRRAVPRHPGRRRPRRIHFGRRTQRGSSGYHAGCHRLGSAPGADRP